MLNLYVNSVKKQMNFYRRHKVFAAIVVVANVWVIWDCINDLREAKELDARLAGTESVY